jgi:hypothetical protein
VLAESVGQLLVGNLGISSLLEREDPFGEPPNKNRREITLGEFLQILSGSEIGTTGCTEHGDCV